MSQLLTYHIFINKERTIHLIKIHENCYLKKHTRAHPGISNTNCSLIKDINTH